MPSPVEMRAIAAFCKKGYRPELSARPYYEFTDKESGERKKLHIHTLLDMYQTEKKEAAKERARLKRQEKKK